MLDACQPRPQFPHLSKEDSEGMLNFVGLGGQTLAWVWALVIQWEEKWVELPWRQADSEGAEGSSPSWSVSLGQGSGPGGSPGGGAPAVLSIFLNCGTSSLPGPAGGAGVSCKEA